MMMRRAKESEWGVGGPAERRQEVVEGSDSLAEGPRHPLSPGDQSAAKTWSQPTKTVVSPSEFRPPRDNLPSPVYLLFIFSHLFVSKCCICFYLLAFNVLSFHTCTHIDSLKNRGAPTCDRSVFVTMKR